MASVFVTSHLVLGDVPTTVSGPMIRVDTAAQAVVVLNAGATAVLSEGRYDLAADTLRLLGCGEEHVIWQVYTSCRDLADLPMSEDLFPTPPAEPQPEAAGPSLTVERHLHVVKDA